MYHVYYKVMFNLLKNIGSSELIIVAIVLAGVFGSQKIKTLLESLGDSTKELRGVKDELENVKSDISHMVGGAK